MHTLLQTPRLRLRRLTEADGDNLYALDSDPRVMRYIHSGIPHSRAHIMQVQLPGFLRCNAETEAPGFVAALDRETGHFLGWFHLRPTGEGLRELELGYRLHCEAWGRGLATEGSRALVDHAFQTLGTRRIIAMALVDNAASIRVMEKVGMRYEKSLIEPSTGEPAVVYGVDVAGWNATSRVAS
ncbi:MAG: GNAT family N-acetyltransferase [Phycisphaeraceae bacterium]